MKKCTDCKYCVQEDYGYSNWTVEGTTADCLVSSHPNFPVDRFYKEEPELNFADQCTNFCAGDGPEIDCDREEDFPNGYSDDIEIRELLTKWGGS